MAASLLNRLRFALYRLEEAVFGRGFPPGELCLVDGAKIDLQQSPSPPFSIRDVVGEGFLWAVPKSRRSLEKRLKRKFGHPDYVLKILQPKTTLKVCNVCGDDHEAGVLCPTCYKKVMDETKEMQEAIEKELKLSPVEKEVVVMYEGEKETQTEFCDGKRIIEMKKPRPSWFSKNLLQKTTQEPATTKDVKPSGLS